MSNAKAAPATADAPSFNGAAVSAYLKQSWAAALEASNNPNVPPQDKPEMFKPPGPAAGAWGGGGAWANRPNPVKDAQMGDGQPFLLGLAKAIDTHKRAKK